MLVRISTYIMLEFPIHILMFMFPPFYTILQINKYVLWYFAVFLICTHIYMNFPVHSHAYTWEGFNFLTYTQPYMLPDKMWLMWVGIPTFMGLQIENYTTKNWNKYMEKIENVMRIYLDLMVFYFVSPSSEIWWLTFLVQNGSKCTLFGKTQMIWWKIIFLLFIKFLLNFLPTYL